MDDIIKAAMIDSDLLATYEDKALDQLAQLSSCELTELLHAVSKHNPKSACEAGAKAIIMHIIPILVQLNGDAQSELEES